MKTRNTLSALLLMVGFLTTSIVFGQSCDTLRNYVVPTNNTYNSWSSLEPGLILGQDEITSGTDTYQTDVWVEPYNIGTTSSEVRAIRMLPWKIQENSGTASLTIQVYDNNAGAPNNVIGSQVVNYTDLNAEMTWDLVEFDVPVSVTGKFYVGYKVSFTTPVDTFALATTQPTSQNYTMFHLIGGTPGDGLNNTWKNVNDVFNAGGNPINSAFAFDVLLSIGQIPVPGFTDDNITACLSGAFTGLDASTTTGTVDTYEWWLTDSNIPVGVIYDDQFGTTATLQPTTTTPSNQRIYLWTDGACVTRGVYSTVTVKPNVTATIAKDDATCGNNNGKITITNPSGGGGSYLYSIDGGTNTGPYGTFTNLVSDTYNVQVSTDGDGCSYSQTVTIGDTPGAVLSVGSDQTICTGSSATITASGSGTIEWFDDATSLGTGTSISVTPTSSKSYNAVLTDANGCMDTKPVNVTINPIDDAGFAYSTNTICLGGGNETPTINTPGGAFTVAQSGLSINSSTGVIDMSTSIIGTYSVTYSTNGTCSNSEIQTITITSSPNATFIYPNTEYCQNEGTVSPDFSGGGSAGTFTSTSGLTISSGNGNINLSSSSVGTYTITNTIAASGACPAASETFDITVKASPTVNAGQDQTICAGESITLTASTTGGTVSWDNSVNDGVSFNPTATDTYTVTANNNGCTATDNVTVTVNPLPTVGAGQDQTVCVNYSALGLSGTPDGGTFSGIGITGNNFNPSAAGEGTFTITYTYTDGNVCENSATLDITVDGCLGLTENELNSVTIAPNPASDFIQVNVGKNNSIETVRIISLEGQIISAGITIVDSHTTEINVSSIAKGTYFIRLSTEKGQFVKKLIVQ